MLATPSFALLAPNASLLFRAVCTTPPSTAVCRLCLWTAATFQTWFFGNLMAAGHVACLHLPCPGHPLPRCAKKRQHHTFSRFTPTAASFAFRTLRKMLVPLFAFLVPLQRAWLHNTAMRELSSSASLHMLGTNDDMVGIHASAISIMGGSSAVLPFSSIRKNTHGRMTRANTGGHHFLRERWHSVPSSFHDIGRNLGHTLHFTHTHTQHPHTHTYTHIYSFPFVLPLYIYTALHTPTTHTHTWDSWAGPTRLPPACLPYHSYHTMLHAMAGRSRALAASRHPARHLGDWSCWACLFAPPLYCAGFLLLPAQLLPPVGNRWSYLLLPSGQNSCAWIDRAIYTVLAGQSSTAMPTFTPYTVTVKRDVCLYRPATVSGMTRCSCLPPHLPLTLHTTRCSADAAERRAFGCSSGGCRSTTRTHLTPASPAPSTAPRTARTCCTTAAPATPPPPNAALARQALRHPPPPRSVRALPSLLWLWN